MIQIHYFSGTGNARKAAEWIVENAAEQDTPSEIIQIRKTSNPFQTSDNHLLGFCYPTHGFNAPPLVLKYLWAFPKGRNRVFLLNTRAGLKLHKLHLPGLGGLALWLPFLILFLKGYKVVGFRPLDMPSNWISLHPGLREKVIISIQNHCKQTIRRFSQRIIQGKKVWNGLLWLPIDLMVSPIAIAYYLIGRFALAKTFFANYDCSRCGRCVKECPVKAIEFRHGRPYWKFSCESCMHCMNLCPEKAIETAHGFTFLLWRIILFGIPTTLLLFLIRYDVIKISELTWLEENVILIVSSIIGIAAIFLAYHAMHFLLKYKWFNRLITWTSLTHLPFWRRYSFNFEKKQN